MGKDSQNWDRQLHYLGRELLWSGRLRSAIKVLEEHVALNRWQQERGQSMVFIGDAHAQLGEDDRAIESWHKAIQIDDTRREPWLRLADYYWRKNNPQRVACYCMAALEVPPNDCYCNVGAHYTYEPHERLYWALWWLGDRERSKEHWKKAIAFDPTNPKYIADRQFYETVHYDYKMPNWEIQGWMTPGELEWLYHTAQRVGSIAEIGSWKGRSSHALLSGCKGTVTCIDTWQGSVDPRDQTNAMAKAEDVLGEFRKNCGHFKNLEICQMASADAAAKFRLEGRKFDMVFIDAGHTYEEVKRDILLWKDLATVVFSGHDYLPQTWMGVCQAVDELVPKRGLSETIWYEELSPTGYLVPPPEPTFEPPPGELPIELPPRIPRRIFTVWLSEDPVLPPVVEKCIASQKAAGGYGHHVITLENCPRDIPYVNAALEARKWGKACDYLRMWEARERGGIYCDADMEILPGKGFDDLLDRSFFASREENGFIAYSLFGCEPGHYIAKGHLEEVEARFRGDDDNYFQASMEILTPRVISAAAADPLVRVLPPEWFIPYNHQTGEINVTSDTRAFHHFTKTWVKGGAARDFLPRIAVLVPTLGRPEGLRRCLESIDRLYYPKHLLKTVVDGGEGTVPEKVNRMARDNPDFDAYVYAANDMEFDPWCVYRAVREAQGSPPRAHPFEIPPHHPFVHGLVSFDAGPLYPDNGNICEHFLITKELTDKLGEVFSEKFHHVGCDNLLWAKAAKLGQAYHSGTAKVTHHHFSKGAPMDEVYQQGWCRMEEDRKTLKEELGRLGT